MSILKNAADSIRIGMEDFHDDDPPRVLSAIRNIYAGILLLFKYKLQELSPDGSKEALLKTNIVPVIDPATGQTTWIGTGKKTVEVRDIIERLSSLGVTGVEWKRLEKLQTIRNDIEHYYSHEPVDRMKEAVANALHLIKQFCEPHLGEPPKDILGDACWNLMLEVTTIYEAELNECRQNLSSVRWTFDEVKDSMEKMRCEHCESQLIKALDPLVEDRDIEFICSDCGETSNYQAVAAAAITENFSISHREIMQGGEASTALCPECRDDSFLIEHGKCAACFYEMEYMHCKTCEEPLSLGEQYLEGSCSYCQHMWEKMMDE